MHFFSKYSGVCLEGSGGGGRDAHGHEFSLIYLEISSPTGVILCKVKSTSLGDRQKQLMYYCCRNVLSCIP